MKDYVTINNYSKSGTLGISRHAIASIAQKAVEAFQGVQVSKQKTLFSVDRGVKAVLAKDGKAVVIKIDIDVSGDAPVQTLCLSIQKEVAQAITLSCDTVPCDVQVRVAKII